VASARWMKVVHDLRLHKGRTALVVLAVAAGLAGASSILVQYSLVRRATEVGYLASDPPAAMLRVDRLAAGAAARVEALPEVRRVETRRSLAVSLWVDGTRHPARLVVAEDLAGSALGRLERVAGSWPEAAAELAVERSSLPLAALAGGDAVELETAAGVRRSLTVSGIVHDVGVAPGWMEQTVYLYATPAVLAGLGESPDLDELRLAATDPALDRAGVRRVAARAAAELEALGSRVLEIDVPVPGRHVHAGQMSSFFFVKAALGLLALLFSGILVLNLMTAVLAGQVREIAMMKAVGARRGQIAGLYLAMVALMGAAAALLALPLAVLAARPSVERTLSMLNFEPTGSLPPAWTLALPALAGVLLPVAAAALPVLRGTRITVAEALRDQGIDERVAHGSRLERLLARLPLRRPLLLSLRNTLRRRGRLALTLLTLATGGGLYIGAENLRTSILHTIDTWFDAIPYDLSVELAEPRPAAELERIVAAVPGVLAVEAWGRARAEPALPDGTRGDGFSVLVPPPDPGLASFRVLRGRLPGPPPSAAAGPAPPGRADGPGPGHEGPSGGPDPAAPGELAVNERWLARVQPAELGDEVTLWIGGAARRWTIVGVVESASRAALAYADAAELGRALGEPAVSGRPATTVLVKIDPTDPGMVSHVRTVRRMKGGQQARLHAVRHGAAEGTAPEDPRAVLADAPRLFEGVLRGAGVPIAGSMAMQTARKGQEDHMVLVVRLLRTMSWLVILVGGFGLATTMSLAVLERTREIGVLRAIGAGHRAILGIVLAEALAIAAGSWLLAIPLSVPMTAFLAASFGRIMFETPMLLSATPTAALTWLGVVLAIAVAAALAPALRAVRLTTREALAVS